MWSQLPLSSMLTILRCIMYSDIDLWTGSVIWSEIFMRNVFLEMLNKLIAFLNMSFFDDSLIFVIFRVPITYFQNLGHLGEFTKILHFLKIFISIQQGKNENFEYICNTVIQLWIKLKETHTCVKRCQEKHFKKILLLPSLHNLHWSRIFKMRCNT